MPEAHTIARPLKRRRRTTRVTADLSHFLDFPSPAVTASASGKPFRDAVRSFLSTNARLTTAFAPPLLPALMTWQILFRVDDCFIDAGDSSSIVVAFYVVEEDVTRSSRSVYCDQCRVVGWSGHPVCRKRYHFIIRCCDNAINDKENKSCPGCANLLHFLESRCRRCNGGDDDVEEWEYSQFQDNTHLLHGIVHSNGYGHLLIVNGREGGSNRLSGFQIMNFWDRLCTTLSVRKVTVMDVSKKYGMEYRLLHAITRGHSWFGNWGYEFGSGSYAVTQDAYKRAVDQLSSMPLSTLLFQGCKSHTRLQNIITFYQSLSCSELSTLKDLFSFLLKLITESHKTSMPKTSKMSESSTNVLCAWTRNDVESLQKAMIKVLMAAAVGFNWVTRRALKGVMCKAASSELLDYCLKHLRGKLTANGMVVEARCNPNSSDFEFRLQPLRSFQYESSMDSNCPSEEHIKGDLKFLLDSLILPETLLTYLPQATRGCVIDSTTKLLDCKQFVKDYKPCAYNSSAICTWCHLELSDPANDDPVPPPELIVLPRDATIGDLKTEATKVFEEVYAMFKRFQVKDLLDYGSVKDNITLKLLVGTTGSVRVQGRCASKHGLNRFRMERGTENWTVDCTCGARDDDGERMLACDMCGVWQHTRCAGIDNADAIPAKFTCMRCTNSFHKKSVSIPSSGKEARRFSQLDTTCRGVVGSDGPQITTTLIVR
ncbi:PHD finger protein At1g33420 isoform X2 [Durio zibethinus]|uniref:PHD finger protein At1g33420 isoform X2 n=1 Tax=Durio zibethinus TaxID=66656 RepID=A0A6P5WQQ1_DURZI|nr:PHD finger protein At1g33420 isoform X2 [Durio zibethinus]